MLAIGGLQWERLHAARPTAVYAPQTLDLQSAIIKDSLGFLSRRGSGVEQPASLSDISGDSQHVQAAAEN